MLVLSRQKDESIMIGDDVEIMIIDVRGGKVRLGIIAPKEIPVHRREVYDAIQKEKEENTVFIKGGYQPKKTEKPEAQNPPSGGSNVNKLKLSKEDTVNKSGFFS